ncbi:gibberellin 2-beta-dioxygenase 6-like isoform X2 [Miscanthus floridulus]|uniref:gibberellin 2-beta-dioxygenase 6-like isoform X2 n=1 Tax=Miscanthus floridulus TaxID=154761 RepID=UPI003457A3FD
MPAFAGSAAEPPLADSYYALLRRRRGGADEAGAYATSTVPSDDDVPVAECELPMIDVGCLTSDDGCSSEAERAACTAAIARAAEEWGFFQVRNHGVSQALLDAMRREQALLFRLPFEAKATAGLLNNSYRWGTPTATSPQQLSWSEAFHAPLAGVSGSAAGGTCNFGELTTLRDVTREVAGAMSKLAGTLARVLAEAVLGRGRPAAGERFPEGCDETTCFLRLNRYPPCPISADAFGLVPHTDSDFLTVLCQDQQVGGLQLMKGARWVAVKPIPGALIVNIGDLLQAWSNNRYKSVEHKVMTNAKTERYSVAYFLCPSYDSPIGTCEEPSLYRTFTFGEYRRKVQEDVKRTGKKVGLPNFLV